MLEVGNKVMALFSPGLLKEGVVGLAESSSRCDYCGRDIALGQLIAKVETKNGFAIFDERCIKVKL